MRANGEHQQADFHQRIDNLRKSTAFRSEEVVDNITEAIVERMLELGLNRAELAELLSVSPARVTNLLRGTNNFTVRTLVDVSAALGCRVNIALVPQNTDSVQQESPPKSGDAGVAAESPAAYRTSRPSSGYASRDHEIREHLASGKLKVEGESIYMLHERDHRYRLARFRTAGTHSTMEKTNVGRRAYYRDRILAISGERVSER